MIESVNILYTDKHRSIINSDYSLKDINVYPRTVYIKSKCDK